MLVHISGNVDPAKALLLGTPEDVAREVRETYRQGWDSPKGFSISTGCDSVWEAPLENSLAFVKEARKCASYPLSPDNFY